MYHFLGGFAVGRKLGILGRKVLVQLPPAVLEYCWMEFCIPSLPQEFTGSLASHFSASTTAQSPSAVYSCCEDKGEESNVVSCFGFPLGEKQIIKIINI